MARIWTKSQIEAVFATKGEKLNIKSGASRRRPLVPAVARHRPDE